MRIAWRVAGLALSAICATAAPAHADDFRVLYAEPIALRAEDASTGAAAFQAGTPQAISFQAYGRQFDLELEPNSSLLSKLTPERKIELSRYELMRGRLAGLPGSWARLTRIGQELHGAIWDGTDLYFVAPARLLAPVAVMPLEASGSTSVVYRLSDTLSSLGPQFCGVRSTGKESAALADYNALVAELRASALAAVPGSQIDVAVIGDFEFYTKYQMDDPQGVLLSTMNVVDGIFSGQVGVTILLPIVTLFTQPNDPFTSNVAGDLLDELGAYREATPEVRSRGLAHLFTARNLTGDTAGIAYRDALCDPFFGVGLTEDSFGTGNTPLIAAHEIGHNFGAPHDAEPGSVCASVLPNFLMAPQVNGSSTFSQCSLDQMTPRVAAAACITRSSIGDAQVVPEPPTLSGLSGDTMPLAIVVNSIGTAPVRDVSVNIQATRLVFDFANIPSGTCSIAGGSVTCSLGTLNDGTSRRIELGARSLEAVDTEVEVLLTASNDRDPFNNFARVRVVVAAAADVTVSVSPEEVVGFTRQPIAFSATVLSAGPRASTDVVATVTVPGMALESATSVGGTCTQNSLSVTCAFGTLAAGASRRIDVQYSGTRAGTFSGQASVNASNDADQRINSDSTTIRLSALRDAAVETATSPITAVIGQSFSFSASVLSVGPQAVHDVTASMLVPLGIVIEALSVEGGTCTLQPSASCTLGDMPAGTSRRIDIRAHGTQVVASGGSILIQGSDDDEVRNDRADVQFDIRHASDIELDPFEIRTGLESRTLSLVTPVTSRGIDASTNIVVNVALPASFRVHQATLTSGSCVINVNTATCTLGRLEGSAQAWLSLEMSGSQPGTYTGSIVGTATNDGNPANNSLNLSLEILPLVDAALVLPAQIQAGALTEILELPFTVNTGPQPVSGIVVFIDLDANRYTLVSASVATGSCAEIPGRITCTLGVRSANSVTPVTIGLRAATFGLDTIRVEVRATNDRDSSNNRGNVGVVIGSQGDTVLRVSTPGLQGFVNQPFAYPTITVSADRPVDDVYVHVPLHPSIAVDSISGDGACSAASGTLICSLGRVSPGADEQIFLTVRGTLVGGFPSTVLLTSVLDTNPDNNAQAVFLGVQPEPPPSPPVDSGGGGGGGGGAFGFLTLVALFAPSVLTRRRGIHPPSRLH